MSAVGLAGLAAASIPARLSRFAAASVARLAGFAAVGGVAVVPAASVGPFRSSALADLSDPAEDGFGDGKASMAVAVIFAAAAGGSSSRLAALSGARFGVGGLAGLAARGGPAVAVPAAMTVAFAALAATALARLPAGVEAIDEVESRLRGARGAGCGAGRAGVSGRPNCHCRGQPASIVIPFFDVCSVLVFLTLECF